jgi:hypothetical protein
MSEDAPLEDELLEWAKGNETRMNKWLVELEKYDIETLKNVAESSKWSCLVSQCSPVLGACMEIWFKERYKSNIIHYIIQ